MSKKKEMGRRDFLKFMGGSTAAVAVGNIFPKISNNPLFQMDTYPEPASEKLPSFVKEVDKPTYTKDIVGDINRFDERRIAFSRADYVPGDGFYEQFYKLYPELKGDSEKLAPYKDPPPVQAKRAGVSLTSYMLANMPFSPAGILADDKIVEPSVSPDVFPVDPADMAHRVKEYAKALGAFDVKIGPLDQRWVYSNRGAVLAEGVWGQPITLNHKTAISIAYPMDFERMNNNRGPAASVEIGKTYIQMATLAITIANTIAGMGYPARAHHISNYQILLVPTAVDAGLGELSRAGYLLHPDLGLDYRLVGVTTDMPLAYDKPIAFGIQDFCTNCKICADNCPAGAISKGEKKERNGVKVWDIDEVKCLSFWGTNGMACATCQTACPWSKREGWVHQLARQYAASGGTAGAVMAELDRVFYGEYKETPTPDWLT
jgi:ferredoxin